jgi:hypothetical protein
MSALSPQVGEVLKVTIVKNHVNDVSDKFVTGYEFETLVGDMGPLNVENLVDALVLFEKGMARSTVEFDRAVVSTWTEEPGGYDPDQFVVFDLAGFGSVAPANDLPLEACLLVRREVQSGRQGRLFLRGYLVEETVEAVAGKWQLSDPGAVQLELDTAISTSGMDQYIGASPTEFGMVLHGPNKAGTVYTRPVQSLAAAGVTWASRSRKHYNRGS